ncbi:MAG: glycosyltransferase family 9 protein [Myxococcota bacterium]|nr:glycosyltransferase family 9 protein [Myxococcota bacterium]
MLVLRLGAVGDVVRTLPAVSALRAAYPEARLTWLVEPASRSVVEGQPWVDEVMVFPRGELRGLLVRGRLLAAARALGRFRGELRARRFDLSVDFHSILKSGLLSWSSGAPQRVAYARQDGREAAWLFANRRARMAVPHASRFARNLALVRFLGVSHEPAPAPLRLDARAERRMGAALAGRPAPVAIHPGTSDATPHKRWTVAGYARLARHLAKSEGLESIVTHGPALSERRLAEAIVAVSDGAARLAPETRSLAELAALFARARLYVGGDTGPTHIASLVGTPVVQILGPTDPVENRPYPDTPSRTVRVEVACNPCRRGCAAATCMRGVSPDAVEAAARELLAGAPPRW